MLQAEINNDLKGVSGDIREIRERLIKIFTSLDVCDQKLERLVVLLAKRGMDNNAYSPWYTGGLVIRTPYSQVDLVIWIGLSPYNEVIWTAEKIWVRLISSMSILHTCIK